jgi:hypothetical protein
MLQGNLIKTTTSDGLEHAGFWVDKKSEVAVFHSHGTSGDFYTHKFIEAEAEKLSEQGISFLTANNRGHDVYADIRKHQNENVEWEQIGGAFEKFEDCLIDIAAWLDFLIDHGVKKIILQAHSLTQKILYYQCYKKDERVIGQIHLSPCNDAGYMYYLLGEKKYNETNRMIEEMVKAGNVKELLPKELSVVCPMGALAYNGYLTENSIGNLFPYHNPESPKWKLLNETNNPLLAIFGGADGFIKPSIKDAANLFKRHAKSAKSITTRIIDGAPHSYIGFEEQLVEIIQNWISDQRKTSNSQDN